MKNEMKSDIVGNSLWSFIAATVSKVGALVFTIILARFLAPERYGIFAIVFSVAMIFQGFADLGMNNALIRYISYSLKHKKEKASAYHFYLFKIKFILIFVFSLLLLLLSYPLSVYVFKKPDMFIPLLVSAVFVFIFSFENFYSKLFYSLEKVKYISFKETAGQIIKIGLTLVVVFLVASTHQVTGIFFILAATAIILLISNLFFAHRTTPHLFKRSSERIDKERVKKFIGYLVVASLSGIFFVYVDSIILGIFLEAKFVGFYRAAFSLIFGIAGILSFPNLVLLSSFSKTKNNVREHFLKASKYIFLISIPAVFGMIILGSYFIQLFFGVEYAKAVIPLYILSPLIFLSVSIGPFLELFSAKEKPRVFAKLIVFASFANILLNLLFIKFFVSVSPTNPIYAVGGAAAATTISWMFYFRYSMKEVENEFNYVIPIEFISKPLAASLAMFILLYIIIRFALPLTIPDGIVLVILGAIIYFITLFILKGIKKEDINSLNSLWRKNENQGS